MDEPKFLAVHTDARPTMDFTREREVIEGGGGILKLTQASTEKELISNVKDANGLLVLGAQITRQIIEAMPKCQIIVRYGVGLDTLDIPAATEHGIVVAHFPDFCQPEVANQAILLLLACAKKLTLLDQAVRSGTWRPGPLGPMGAIEGETLGLIAFGNIARTVVPRAKALGLNVIAWDPYVGEGVFRSFGVERVTKIEELLNRSDYVSVHAPLSESTRGLIGKKEFQAMKSTAYIINTARGPVIDESALINALQNEEIAGAGLDVFEVEPLPNSSPLTKMNNVVLMPHSASYSDDSFASMQRRVGETITGIMEGRWPEYVANPNVTPRATLPPRG